MNTLDKWRVETPLGNVMEHFEQKANLVRDERTTDDLDFSTNVSIIPQKATLWLEKCPKALMMMKVASLTVEESEPSGGGNGNNRIKVMGNSIVIGSIVEVVEKDDSSSGWHRNGKARGIGGDN